MPAGRPSVLDAGAVLHLQNTAGNAAVRDLVGPRDSETSPVLEVVGSNRGKPLDDTVRRLMEDRFGADFAAVRIHTDEAATASAKHVNAHAYTVGDDIVFQGDLYNPQTRAGRRMLAHELAHVIQQRAGPVPGTPAPGGIKISDPSDAFELEAERTAARIASNADIAPLPQARARATSLEASASNGAPERSPNA